MSTAASPLNVNTLTSPATAISVEKFAKRIVSLRDDEDEANVYGSV